MWSHTDVTSWTGLTLHCYSLLFLCKSVNFSFKCLILHGCYHPVIIYSWNNESWKIMKSTVAYFWCTDCSRLCSHGKASLNMLKSIANKFGIIPMFLITYAFNMLFFSKFENLFTIICCIDQSHKNCHIMNCIHMAN